MKNKLHYVLCAFMLFATTACLNQAKAPKIPGVTGPKVNMKDGKIILSVGLDNIEAPGGFTVPIPKLPNSSASISPELTGGTLVQVAFDLKDVESGLFNVVPHETLPDGRAFPFTVDGTLPAIAINVPKLFDTTFYASKQLFGFFLPLNLPKELPASLHYRLKVNGKNIGIVSLIHPNSSGDGGGMVLVLTLQEIRNNPDFKKLLEYSKKNKNVLF